MKLFLLGLLLLPSLVLGQQTPSQKNYDPPFNLLMNGNFEKKLSGWTNSGGTFSHVTSGSNLIFDKGSGVFDASATSQYVQTKLYSVSEGLKGASCLGRVYYKGGDSNLTLQVLDGSSNVLGSSVFTASTVTVPNSVVFSCPSSGSVRLKILSSANAAIIAIDNAHIGIADNSMQISQSTFAGSLVLPAVANCIWTNATAGYTNFAADSDCSSSPTVSGNLAYAGSKIPGFTYTDMPPGEYLIVINGNFGKNNAAGAASYRISDGTINSEGNGVYQNAATDLVSLALSFHVSVPTAGTRTWQLQGNSGSATNTIYNDTGTAGTAASLAFYIYRFPTSQQTAYRFDTMANSWSGYHDKDCQWPTTSSYPTFADPTMDASCGFVERTNVNFGTVSSHNDGTPGNNLPGIVFTPGRIGTYKVCANAALENDTANQEVFARLWDGTTTIGTGSIRNAGGGLIVHVPVCGLYKATAISPVTLRIQLNATGGTSYVDGNTDHPAIEWNIYQIDQQIPAPLLINSVVSPRAGIEQILRFKVGTIGAECTSDPCTITSQSGGISSVNRTSLGNYDINFSAGTFSAPPVCTLHTQSTGLVMYPPYQSVNATSTLYSFRTYQSSNALADSTFEGICMGPK